MRKLICYFIVFMGVTSCASLPKETVEMSLMVDRQLEALQQSHLDLLESYYAAKEKEIISFLDDRWYPVYINNLFELDDIKEAWQRVIESQDLDERMLVMKVLTQSAQEDYKEQKAIMMEPIYKSRVELRQVILFEYQKAKEMNRLVSDNIASVNEVQEARNKILSKAIDIDKIDNQMQKSIQKIDSIFNKSQDILDKYKKNEQKINKVINKI